MARRSKGFIELEWTCPNCETRNKGSVKTCASCGAPQPENVQFEAPGEKKLVSDEKASKLRKRGADIHCGFCGTRNPSTAETCSQCGGDLSEGVARQAGREIDMSTREPQIVSCANCGKKNQGTNSSCEECGAPLPRAKKALEPAAFSGIKQAAMEDTKKKKPNWKVLGAIGGALLLCCIAALALLFIPSSSAQASVTDVYWQTSVPLQEIQAVSYSNERGSPPSDAYNVSCWEDSQEVCEERTIDRGDGFAEVVEDCHTETEQYCDYTIDEWTTVQTYTLEGHDTFPVYEQPNISNDQRLGNQSENLTVTFNSEKGQKSYSPNSVSEFQQFQIGSTWTLKLNAIGGVVGVER